MEITKELIQKAIKERRTIYPINFDPVKKIEDINTIRNILDTAVWAPTHKLTQPWNFKVFHGDGVKTFFSKQQEIYKIITPEDAFSDKKYLKYMDKAEQVSVVIAVWMKRDPEKRVPEIEEIVATGCVIENIYLSLKPHGIVGYLSTGDICYTRQMKEFLEIGEEDKCLGFFQLGYPKESMRLVERKRVPANEKTEWITS
jgi:nitroreductase